MSFFKNDVIVSNGKTGNMENPASTDYYSIIPGLDYKITIYFKANTTQDVFIEGDLDGSGDWETIKTFRNIKPNKLYILSVSSGEAVYWRLRFGAPAGTAFKAYVKVILTPSK